MTSHQNRKMRDIRFLVPVSALVFAALLAAPVGIDRDGLTLNPAQAEKGGNGKGGGNGNGNGRDGAPGQAKNKDGADSGADPEASIGAEGSADGGSRFAETEIPMIAEDLPPASVEVIREIAGLPEQSGLSEEEEMDAIRNGWGSWRTADGPAGRAIQ